MSTNFVQSNVLRTLALAGLRLKARLGPAGTTPTVFINSIPKAGTHLIMAELDRMDGLVSSSLHIKSRDVNALSHAGRHVAGFELNVPQFDRLAGSVKKGQYFTAHLPWSAELSRYLAEKEIRTIFIYRDPRAVLVSNYFYIRDLRRHHLHNVFTALPSDEARYAMLIEGREEDPQIMSMRERLLTFQGWIDDPGVLALRFEDLVGERGGGDTETKARALASVAAFVGIDGAEIDALARTGTKPTPTMREGKIDTWRKSIPAASLDLFDRECGDLLQAQGYARD